MNISPINRDLLVVIIVVASGLMFVFFANYAHAEPIVDLKVSDTSQVTSVQDGGVDRDAIRPFHVNIPEGVLLDLRRRLVATGWPEQETVGTTATRP
jgi:hypothetical protein